MYCVVDHGGTKKEAPAVPSVTGPMPDTRATIAGFGAFPLSLCSDCWLLAGGVEFVGGDFVFDFCGDS